MRKIRYFKVAMTRIVSSIFLIALQRLPEITIYYILARIFVTVFFVEIYIRLYWLCR